MINNIGTYYQSYMPKSQAANSTNKAANSSVSFSGNHYECFEALEKFLLGHGKEIVHKIEHGIHSFKITGGKYFDGLNWRDISIAGSTRNQARHFFIQELKGRNIVVQVNDETLRVNVPDSLDGFKNLLKSPFRLAEDFLARHNLIPKVRTNPAGSYVVEVPNAIVSDGRRLTDAKVVGIHVDDAKNKLAKLIQGKELIAHLKFDKPIKCPSFSPIE